MNPPQNTLAFGAPGIEPQATIQFVRFETDLDTTTHWDYQCSAGLATTRLLFRHAPVPAGRPDAAGAG